MLNEVRKIVKWIKKSNVGTADLIKEQKKEDKSDEKILKLILDVKTRWNSTYEMLCRFLELSSVINNVLLRHPNSPRMFSAIDLKYVEEISILLKPFKTMTVELSGEKFATASKIIPLLNCVQEQFLKQNPSCEIGINLKEKLGIELKKRFGKVEYNFLISAACILDPRFKNIHFKDPVACSKTLRHIRDGLNVSDSSLSARDETTELENDDDDDLWHYHKTLAYKTANKQLDSNADELTLYLAAPTSYLKEDPFQYWCEMKSIYPGLYKLSLKYLPVLATSVPSERPFSKAGATIT